PELRDVGLNSYRCDAAYQDVRLSIGSGVAGADGKMETNSPVSKSEFVGPGGTDDPIVGAQQILRPSVVIKCEAGPVDPAGSSDSVVNEVTDRQAMIGVEGMVHAGNILLVVYDLSSRHTNRAEFHRRTSCSQRNLTKPHDTGYSLNTAQIEI